MRRSVSLVIAFLLAVGACDRADRASAVATPTASPSQTPILPTIRFTPAPAGYPTPGQRAVSLPVAMTARYDVPTLSSRLLRSSAETGPDGYYLGHMREVAFVADGEDDARGMPVPGPVLAIDLRTGRRIWKSVATYLRPGDFDTAFVYRDSLYISSSGAGQYSTTILSTRDGSVQSKRTGFAPYGVHGNTVYLQRGNLITACEPTLRRCSWKVELEGLVIAEPVFAGHQIIASYTSGGAPGMPQAEAYDIASGKELWASESDIRPVVGISGHMVYVATTGIPSPDWYLPFVIDAISERSGLVLQSYRYVPDPKVNAIRWGSIANSNTCSSVVKLLAPAHVSGNYLYVCVGNVWYRYPSLRWPVKAMRMGSLQPFLWLDNDRIVTVAGNTIGTATMFPDKVAVRSWFEGTLSANDVVIDEDNSRFLALGRALFALSTDGSPARIGPLPCVPERLISWPQHVSALCPIEHATGRMPVATYKLAI